MIPYIESTWSLNYEILDYGLLPLVVLLQPRIIVLLLILLLTICLSVYFGLPFAGNYAVGYTFWISGLLIAWKLDRKDTNVNMLSYLFLITTYWLYQPANHIFEPIKFNDFGTIGLEGYSFFHCVS